MLRKMLGDSVFFKAMQQYVNNPKLQYANVTTDDFIHECETASGQILAGFFNSGFMPHLIQSTDRSCAILERQTGCFTIQCCRYHQTRKRTDNGVPASVTDCRTFRFFITRWFFRHRFIGGTDFQHHGRFKTGFDSD